MLGKRQPNRAACLPSLPYWLHSLFDCLIMNLALVAGMAGIAGMTAMHKSFILMLYFVFAFFIYSSYYLF